MNQPVATRSEASNEATVSASTHVGKPTPHRLTFSRYRYLVFSDFYRLFGHKKLVPLIRHLVFSTESFRYVFWMRTCRYAANQSLLRVSLYPVARLVLHRLTFQMGIAIPHQTQIGPGFFIGHFGGIVVNKRTVIGRNCNISQGVTLGQVNRGALQGCPTIGDNVFIGPGAKVIGAITIGNNVAIGANCVVTKDIPDNAVVVGIPGRMISEEGSQGYINRTDYDE